VESVARRQKSRRHSPPHPVEYLDLHPRDEVVLPTNRWRPPLLPPVAWNPWLDVKNRDDIRRLNLSFPFGVMPDNVTKEIIRSYNAATSYIDDLIGRLLKKVDLDSTVVVLTSDHGWSRGEHGEFSKFSNFDVSTRVPLLIHVPGLSRAEVIVDQLVELVDLFPTLVDLTQAAPALEICARDGHNSKLCTEGRSLVPILVANERKQVFFLSHQSILCIGTSFRFQQEKGQFFRSTRDLGLSPLKPRTVTDPGSKISVSWGTR
jgi:iduronate 2-sulfatase